MANEAAGGLAGAQLPETESLVPGATESVGAVGGDDTVGDNVRVAVQRALRVAVRGIVTGQVPDDERLVARAGEEHVRVLERGRKGRDPAGVALKGAAEDKLFGHDCCAV